MVNSMTCEVIGLPKDRIVGRDWFECFIPQEIRTDVRRVLRDLISGRIEPVEYYENPVVRPDGSKLLIAWHNTVTRNASGAITGIMSAGHDVTKVRKTEQDLRHYRDLNEIIQQLIKVGSWEWDQIKQQMTWTEETYRIHGFRPQDVVEGSPEHISRSLKCYDPSDRVLIEGLFKRCCETGESYSHECPFTPANGGRLWIRTIGKAVLENGHVVRVHGHIMDLTEQKQTGVALRQSEERFRTLVESLPDIIMLFDREGRHIYVSGNVETVVDFQVSRFIGKTHRELGFPEQLCRFWEDAIKRVFDSGEPYETEFEHQRQGQRLIFNWRLVPECDAAGEVRSVLSISRDITRMH
ncbi:MAG: PAS domain S-box protein, partial [Candidatus Wallbacteria bacterium]|nr:PAS domain S-box protein [Candidatus Wallbacteria bacterium]